MTTADRALFLREMQAGVGLTAAPATLADFEMWVGGAEVSVMRHSMATYRDPKSGVFSSTCGLGIRDALRCAGFTARWLQPHYVVGSVMTNIKDEGQRASAVNLAMPTSLPGPGDIFGLGWSGADAHVAVVETPPEVDTKGVVAFYAVEAGQITTRNEQACARKRHTWTWDPRTKRYSDRSLSLTTGIVDGTHAREVSWWIDVAKLPAGGQTDPFTRGIENVKTDPAPPPSSTGTSTPGTSSPVPLTVPSVTLRLGSSGDAVKLWQRIIGPKPDGAFGPATEAATKAWQLARGLTPDGVVGPRSWAAALAEQQTTPGSSATPPAAPSVAPLEGIDVSSIQGVIDWARVKASGISFAYVRALIGRDDQDRRLTQNCAGALAAGLDVGVYGILYPRAGKPQDANEQARQLGRLHQDNRCTLRPMIDFESLGDVKATPEEWATALALYVDTFQGVGVYGLDPIVYTYPSFWRGLGPLFADPQWLKRSPALWIAHYTKAAQPDVPPPWSKALVWQYLASAPGFEGRVDGVPGLVDRNKLFGTLDALRVKL